VLDVRALCGQFVCVFGVGCKGFVWSVGLCVWCWL
jgi:hypothetical protein